MSVLYWESEKENNTGWPLPSLFSKWTSSPVDHNLLSTLWVQVEWALLPGPLLVPPVLRRACPNALWLPWPTLSLAGLGISLESKEQAPSIPHQPFPCGHSSWQQHRYPQISNFKKVTFYSCGSYAKVFVLPNQRGFFWNLLTSLIAKVSWAQRYQTWSRLPADSWYEQVRKEILYYNNMVMRGRQE